jgi:hypothetical protein
VGLQSGGGEQSTTWSEMPVLQRPCLLVFSSPQYYLVVLEGLDFTAPHLLNSLLLCAASELSLVLMFKVIPHNAGITCYSVPP